MRARLAAGCSLALLLAGCALAPEESADTRPAYVVAVYAQGTQWPREGANGSTPEPTAGAARYGHHCGQGSLEGRNLTILRQVMMESGRPPRGWQEPWPAAAIYIEDRDGHGPFGNAPSVVTRDALPLDVTLEFHTGDVTLTGGGDAPLLADGREVPVGEEILVERERQSASWRYTASYRIVNLGEVPVRQVPTAICI